MNTINKRIFRKFFSLSIAVIILVPFSANATNGLMPYGNGMIAHGMGGAGIANGSEPMSGLDNPALILDQAGFSIGASVLNLNRSANIGRGYIDSDKEWFLIPQAGWVTKVNNLVSWGILANVLGGMNTSYPKQLFGAQTGVDLSSVVVAPTIAIAASSRVTLGGALLVGYEVFETTGPGVKGLPSNNKDSAVGFGWRMGVAVEINDKITGGFNVQSKLKMNEMDVHCKHIFADIYPCDLSLPAIHGLGISVQPNDRWKLISDLIRINWSEVAVIKQKFGWKNQIVFKVGTEFKLNQSTAVRFGFNHGDSPIANSQIRHNVLAPAITEDHLTVGFSKTFTGGGVITGYYGRIFANEQVQSGAGFPQVKMDQNAFGFSYTKTM